MKYLFFIDIYINFTESLFFLILYGCVSVLQLGSLQSFSTIKISHSDIYNERNVQNIKPVQIAQVSYFCTYFAIATAKQSYSMHFKTLSYKVNITHLKE